MNTTGRSKSTPKLHETIHASYWSDNTVQTAHCDVSRL